MDVWWTSIHHTRISIDKMDEHTKRHLSPWLLPIVPPSSTTTTLHHRHAYVGPQGRHQPVHRHEIPLLPRGHPLARGPPCRSGVRQDELLWCGLWESIDVKPGGRAVRFGIYLNIGIPPTHRSVGIQERAQPRLRGLLGRQPWDAARILVVVGRHALCCWER